MGLPLESLSHLARFSFLLSQASEQIWIFSVVASLKHQNHLGSKHRRAYTP